MIAEEAGEFTIDDVAADIIAKMHRRNPHVFGAAGGPADAGRRRRSTRPGRRSRPPRSSATSVTDGIPPTLPALLYADKVLDRLARAGPSARQP